MNLGGSSNFGTSTAPMYPQAAAPPPPLLRAPGDWSAGVHDGVVGNNGIRAWRTTARAALLIPLVMLLDATWTTLGRPGSGSRTPDAVGKDRRVHQGVPGGDARGATRGGGTADARVITDGRAGTPIGDCRNAQCWAAVGTALATGEEVVRAAPTGRGTSGVVVGGPMGVAAVQSAINSTAVATTSRNVKRGAVRRW